MRMVMTSWDLLRHQVTVVGWSSGSGVEEVTREAWQSHIVLFSLSGFGFWGMRTPSLELVCYFRALGSLAAAFQGGRKGRMWAAT